jgi:translocation and assembly module TamB
VHRSDFSATVESELDVIYMEPELRVGGYVDFQQGVFETMGKSFEINSGSLNFDGSAELNPEVTVTATYTPEVSGSSPVVVTVTGTMDDPRISFVTEQCEGEQGALTMLLTGSCALSESEERLTDPNAQRENLWTGMVGGILTLGTSGVRSDLGGLIPKPILERRTEQGIGRKTYRIGAGVDADPLIPKFMRGVIRGAYIESAYAQVTEVGTDAEGEQSAGADTTDVEMRESSAIPLDFLLELRFPYDLIWTGTVSPPQNWSTDVIWEP